MKKMKKLFVLGIATMLILTTTAMAHTACDPDCRDLIAGGGNPKSEIDAGDVMVWNDGCNLYVKFVTDGWMLTETHLYVSSEGIGKPAPGKFNYQMEFDPAVDEYTYVIPLNSWEPCTTLLYIAAHAVVQNGCDGKEETAWGDGCVFPKSKWKTYFTYTVQ